MARPSRRTPSIPALAVLVALVLALAACTSATPSAAPASASTAPTAAPSPTAPAFPVTVTDDEGTAVAIPAAPQRIVSLTPATTEILFALGAGGRVVAKVEDVADYPPAAHAVPVVATFSGVDVEKIVSLGADLVIAGGAGLSQGPAVEQLRRAGIPVLVLYPTSVDGALAGIAKTGAAVGLANEAGTLVARMRQRIDLLTSIVVGLARPRVFYEIDATNGIYTPPADSIYGEMLALAGSNPVSGDANYSISLEALVTADPDVILLGDAAYGVTADQVKARPGWAGIAAVRSGRIVPIDDIVVTRPGPRLVDGLEALIRAIHPDAVIPSAPPAG
jgi:iron complex transport system substrate-binding protein